MKYSIIGAIAGTIVSAVFALLITKVFDLGAAGAFLVGYPIGAAGSLAGLYFGTKKDFPA